MFIFIVLLLVVILIFAFILVKFYRNKYVIFPAEYSWIAIGSTKGFTASEEEVRQADNLFRDFLQNQKDILKLENYRIKNLWMYKVQYVGFVNEKGERNIWANYFCNTMDRDWKKEIVHIDGGGNCFFQVEINLDTKTVYNFMVNRPY